MGQFGVYFTHGGDVACSGYIMFLKEKKIYSKRV